MNYPHHPDKLSMKTTWLAARKKSESEAKGSEATSTTKPLSAQDAGGQSRATSTVKPANSDYDHPANTRCPLEKIGVYHWSGGATDCGFSFFDRKVTPKNGDIFIYNKGILFRVKR